MEYKMICDMSMKGYNMSGNHSVYKIATWQLNSTIFYFNHIFKSLFPKRKIIKWSHNPFKILMFGLVLLNSSTQIVYSGWFDHVPLPINSDDNTGDINVHFNSGGRRIVRIDDTSIVICPLGNGEYTYRSIDDGVSWERIDTDGASSGCLITGPDKMVYHFYRYYDDIYMVKFRYDSAAPTPVSIFTDENISETITGVYKAINAIVGPDGTLYVACHWGNPDRLYLLRSTDSGQTWTGPYEISEGASGWYYPHLEVNSSNELVCTYDKFVNDDHEIVFAKSLNGGQSWSRQTISREITYNPSLLTVGDRSFYVFAQSAESQHTGLVYKKSTDKGETWTEWQLIDSTCGYADPSPALGADGRTIFVAYRSSNGTGVTTGTCGDRSRSRMAMSPDLGDTWQFVDNHYEGERTGTRSQVRYQTWWNYGGPLEWIWMQYENNGASRPIYYDVNNDIPIYQIDPNDKSDKPANAFFLAPILMLLD